MEKNDALKQWKKLGIGKANFIFQCGGDSMGDTSIEFFDSKGKEIVKTTGPVKKEGLRNLAEYFDDQVYHHVDFYVNSDGHYQGESGIVEITYDEDENESSFSKSSTSEWSEAITNIMEVELDDNMAAFVRDKVLNIVGSSDETSVNYKGDCILTDKDITTESELIQAISEATTDFVPDIPSGAEADDWFTFTTSVGGADHPKLNGNKLKVEISNSVIIYKDDEY